MGSVHITEELKQALAKELKEFMVLNNFDRKSYELGILHGSKVSSELLFSYDAMPAEIIATIAQAVCYAINMAHDSGLSNEELADAITVDDIRHIIKNHDLCKRSKKGK